MRFDVPVRIRWDADPPSALTVDGEASPKFQPIFNSIVDASPLALDITVESQETLEELRVLLNGIDSPIGVSLFLAEGIVMVKDEGLKEFCPNLKVYYHGENCGDLEGESFWLDPDPARYGDSFKILDRFFSSSGKLLVLKNLNLRKKGLPGEVREVDFDRLLSDADIDLRCVKDGKKVIIHDYFLWRFISDTYPEIPGTRAEFEGCQGGNTLGYIDWEGVVYPCETLLAPLGRVPEDPISDIWSSPGRKSIWEEVREIPPPCRPCEELKGCFGGCRGLAYHFREGLEHPDPQCDKPHRS